MGATGGRETSGEGSWRWLVETAEMQIPQSCPQHPLQDDEEVSEFALDGLKQVMAIKSRVVLPYLVPKVNPNMWSTPSGSRALTFQGLQ